MTDRAKRGGQPTSRSLHAAEAEPRTDRAKRGGRQLKGRSRKARRPKSIGLARETTRRGSPASPRIVPVIYLFIYLSIYISIYLSIYLSICVCVCVCVCVYNSVGKSLTRGGSPRPPRSPQRSSRWVGRLDRTGWQTCRSWTSSERARWYCAVPDPGTAARSAACADAAVRRAGPASCIESRVCPCHRARREVPRPTRHMYTLYTTVCTGVPQSFAHTRRGQARCDAGGVSIEGNFLAIESRERGGTSGKGGWVGGFSRVVLEGGKAE